MKISSASPALETNAPAKPQASAKERAKIGQLAEEFESMFLEIVFKTMRASVEKSGFMDGGNAEEIYRSMLDTEYAKSMAAQRQTGLADSLERQLLANSQIISESLHSAKQTQGERAYELGNAVRLLPKK